MITVTAARMTHITFGDRTGGGHMLGYGDPLKSKFPASWGAVRIKTELLAVANNPASVRFLQPNGNHRITGTDSEGHRLTVIARGNEVVTAWPG
jgi:hypothetical protein